MLNLYHSKITNCIFIILISAHMLRCGQSKTKQLFSNKTGHYIPLWVALTKMSNDKKLDKLQTKILQNTSQSYTHIHN